MAVYFITGKLGSGKTLCAVGKIRDYMEQGRRVATNLDLNLNKMLFESSQQSAIRLPDKPRLEDMQAIGDGCIESNESKYGCIVLDELGTWFNSRNWRDKERIKLIDWFLHARKHHWDIYFIVQSIESLDGQLVNALCEHLVICKRTDRLSVPIIGPLIRFLGFQSVFPKIHIAKVYYGSNESAMSVDRWWYRGKDLYNCYDTDQKFLSGDELLNVPVLDKNDNVTFDNEGNIICDTQPVDMRATFTILSPYYQNSVKLRENLIQQLSDLSNGKNGAKTAQPAAGGFLQRYYYSQKSLVLTTFFILVVSVYGITRKDDNVPLISNAVANVESIPIKNNLDIQKSLVLTSNQVIEPIDNDLDPFQTNLSGSIIKVEELVSYGDTFHGKLRLINPERNYSITFEELRMNGYWLTKEQRYFVIQKDKFHLKVKI